MGGYNMTRSKLVSTVSEFCKLLGLGWRVPASRLIKGTTVLYIVHIEGLFLFTSTRGMRADELTFLSHPQPAASQHKKSVLSFLSSRG